MNPGPVEEAGKVAGGFIDAMKTQPLALALCIMNLGLMFLFYVIANTAGHRFDVILEQQKEVQKLLYNCTPLASSQRYKPADAESHPYIPLPPERPPEANPQ